MKLRFAFFTVSLLNLFALTGCNSVGDKDTILARIDKEVVYREDLVLLMKNSISSKEPLNKRLYENVYAKEAVVSKALTQFPELNKEWEEFLGLIEPKLLASVYQRFYLNERLTYSEPELRHFYDEHRSLFDEAPLPDFSVIQGIVACEYYMSHSKEALNAYLKEHLMGSTSREDSITWKTKFVELHRSELKEQIARNLASDLHVTFHELPKPEPKAFYEKHMDMFMTAPGYELYHVQGTDSVALAALFNETTDLENFKKIASTKSANKATAKEGGFVGYVKDGFAMPYGIGMVSGLSAALNGKDAGFVSPVIKDDVGNAYHVFYLSSLVQPKQKTFDRVEASIKQGLASGEFFDVDSSYVLLSENGETLLTEGELKRICKRDFMAEVNARNHQHLFSMVVERLLFSKAALNLKLDKTWEYRALVRAARRNFIFDNYFFKKRQNVEVSEDSLKAFYERYGSPVHQEYSFEQGRSEVRAAAMFPMNILRHEYFLSKKSSYFKLDFKQTLPVLFRQNWRMQSDMSEARFAAESYQSAVLHFYDSSIQEWEPTILADRLVANADSLRKEGLNDEALEAYRNLIFAYGENDSLVKLAIYESAQIYNETGRFEEAEAEYQACYEIFPDSPEAEKSLFSRGFILSENLNKNDEALQVLKTFQQKYPNSELKESVDWLVQNIESDGKLADDLLKKISAEE